MTDQPTAGVALKPFAEIYDKAFSGLSDGIEVRLDASFDLQDAIGRARGVRYEHQPIHLTVGDFHAAKTALRTPAPGAVEAVGLKLRHAEYDLLEGLSSSLPHTTTQWQNSRRFHEALRNIEAVIKALGVPTLAALTSEPKAEGEAVPVTIFCPVCAVPHVDEGEWATTRKHKTHQCQGCGHEWRPFPFATVGVPHPAPQPIQGGEVTREAVEAARKIGRWIDAGMPDHSDDTPTRDALRRDLRSVLSALISPAQREGERP